MPGRKNTPSLGEKAYSFSPGPVVQSSILKTISWINVTFDSSLTTNRSQDRKKALLLPLLFPRGYFFLPCKQRFLYGKSFSLYIVVVRVSGISRCRLAYVPGDVITSRPLSMKNYPQPAILTFFFYTFSTSLLKSYQRQWTSPERRFALAFPICAGSNSLRSRPFKKISSLNN